jgi:hypothetical protein
MAFGSKKKTWPWNGEREVLQRVCVCMMQPASLRYIARACGIPHLDALPISVVLDEDE